MICLAITKRHVFHLDLNGNLRIGFPTGGVDFLRRSDEFAWAVGLGMYTGVIEFNFATSYFQSVVSPNSAKNKFHLHSVQGGSFELLTHS